MTNPISGIHLYKIEYHDEGNGKQAFRDLITIAYQGKSGVVRAYHGYGDRQLAKVGGYGYDKISTALAEAIQELTGVDMDVNGAAGHAAVRDYAASKGIVVRDMLAEAIKL